MPVVFINRQKDILVNFFRKFSFILPRYKYTIAALSLLVTVSLLLPALFLTIFFDKNEFNKQIHSLSSTNNLLFTSDGVIRGNFRDIIFYNVRIKDASESPGQLPLLAIPELRIKVNILRSVMGRKTVLDKIILKDARWRYVGKDGTFNKELQASIADLLGRHGDFNLVLVNNTVTLVFEKKNYDRETWNIVLKRGSIRSLKNKVTVTFRYDDLPWGNGQLTFSPLLCPQCSLFQGTYEVRLQELPLNRLSWFFAPLKLQNGMVDIASDVTYTNNGKENEIEIKADIQVKDILATEASNSPVLENPRLDLDIRYSDKAGAVQSEFTGYWKKSPFKGAFAKKHKSVYPETLSFSLDNNGRTIPLLYGFKLKGLQSFRFDLGEDKTGKAYRILNGNFVAEKGAILNAENVSELQIPRAVIKLENNACTGSLSLARNSSDLNFSFSGSVLPINKMIDTVVEFEDYQKNKNISYNGVVFEITETGELNSENLHWKDIEPYYDYARGAWKNSVKNDLYRGWRPSLFRERDWFQKYLMRTSFNNTVIIKDWHSTADDNGNTPLSGLLNLNNSIFNLELAGGDQRFNFSFEMTGNTPIIRGDYKLALSRQDSFSNRWLPAGLVPKFGSSTVEAKYTASGERPIDIVENYNATAAFLLENVSVLIADKKTSDVLTRANLDVRSYGTKYQVNLGGENDVSTVSSWGNYDPENNGWKINSTILPKR